MSTTIAPLIAEYVWLSGENTYSDIRSKCKTLYIKPDSALDQYPEWNFDGSSTNQAFAGKDTEILIRPVKVLNHPFVEGGKVVLCDCYYPDGTPTKCNTRVLAKAVFDRAREKQPWYGFEQEYVLYQGRRPLGWPAEVGTFPAPQGPYYCGTGGFMHGRDLALAHTKLCLSIGLQISGNNAEVMPGQWEYQVGPCEGIDAGDQAILARWVYLRLGEKHGVSVCFEAKPMQGDWNGSGCHTNFSTKEMREPNGIVKINEAIDRLSKTYQRDIVFYGQDNDKRMTGHHETSTLDKFSFGIGTRHTSVRIPNETNRNKCGYFEDRRPAATIDPYLLSSRLFSSACGVPAPELDVDKLDLFREWMHKVGAKRDRE